MTEHTPEPDPNCENCDGVGCMGCALRKVWLSRAAAANYVWEPGTVVHLDPPADPWDACAAVDPPTDPDQHRHGDACPGECT